uniref:Putative secreted protein n=1 Tax=Amblyomma triste TaxID=251400 RepID=A0A023G2U8_AMBTT
MAPASILLPVVLFISSCGFAVGQQGQRNAAAPFSVGGTINSAPQGSSGAGGLGLEHFQVASDLKQALSLRVPQDFLRDHLGDYHFKNPNILLKALLHPTYKTRDRKDRKDRHDSFEPLDYVGSFVMDYIVSRYVLMHARNKSPAPYGRGEGVGPSAGLARLLRCKEQLPQVRLRRPARRESVAQGICRWTCGTFRHWES